MRTYLLFLILVSMWVAGISMEERVDKIIAELAIIKNIITQEVKECHNLDTIEVKNK